MMVSSLRMLKTLSVVLYFILFDDVSSNQITYQIKDDHNNAVYLRLEPIGCYADHPKRALRVIYLNLRRRINWHLYPDNSYIIRACAQKAYRQSFPGVFGVQFYGECWSDGFAGRRYGMYGASSNCEHGVGKEWANMVYRFQVVQPTIPQTESLPELLPPKPVN